MKGRTLALVVISGVFAVGAAQIANNWAIKRNSPALTTDQQSVVVAAMEIPYGQKIEAQHIKLVTMDKKVAPPGTFDTTEAVVGKVSKIEQLPGDILRQERVSGTAEGSTLAVLIGKNKRAITVRVDDVIGVAGFLLPGNRVDVLATKQTDSQRTVESKTLLQDLKVLAVDQTAATDKSSPVVVRAVTLEIEPKQAEILVKARDEGKISLALRNPFDESLPEEPKPVEKKVAVRMPAPALFTTVIRGTDISQVKQ